MLELAESLLAALAGGHRLAVATVIEVDGSAPRALGTSMAVDDAGQVIGSISGGCVEGAVYDACTRVLDTGDAEICEFGFTDDDAFAVGLSCGGRLTVFVRELGPPDARNELPAAVRGELERAATGQATGIALLVPADVGDEMVLVAAHERAEAADSGGAGEAAGVSHDGESNDGEELDSDGASDREDIGPSGNPDREDIDIEANHDGEHGDRGRDVDEAAAAGALAADIRSRVATELTAGIHAGRSVRRRIDCEGTTVEVVLLVSSPPPRMIIFGAVDFSVALSRAAALLGYRVTVCDARPVFATATRFPGAEVVNQWPTDYLRQTVVDERTALCILTHDDKFDVPLIEAALSLPVAYVGAMGSRATHDRRVAKLLERGLDEAALASLHSPIGLDLGAASPEETAVSILAEILAARNASSGRSLRSTSGPIHRAAAEAAGSRAARQAALTPAPGLANRPDDRR
ncbi:XdhC family protein [Herbiconiux daphne]|uniref:XdhC family protein n=1 Tax=Herbiconiux daphne TaxID=2970914 RepID=A0ABT2H2X9_9MICO|nr:XdhC/CoxI family protein [Herbiconiux daphne]MCS5734309.1 XdhC family protein [Herbiconiux daphne]